MSLVSYIILGAILFIIGAIGAFVRKEILRIFVAVEIMVAAANVLLVAFVVYAAGDEGPSGLVLFFFVWLFSIANAAVGLTLFLIIRNKLRTQHTGELKRLGG